MKNKFLEGLAFGAGFGISLLLICYVAVQWVAPWSPTAREQQTAQYADRHVSGAQDVAPKFADSVTQETPFHELPLEQQIQGASVIALARYEKSSDGKMRAIIKEFLKKDPAVTIYYEIGDEFSHASYYPKENTGYGDGVIIFFTGSPATMSMSMTFSADRIMSLGDLPLALLKKKCEADRGRNTPANSA